MRFPFSVTRRSFVEQALAVAAAATAGGRPIAAEHGATGSGRVLGPNDRIRVAVVGVGPTGRGFSHIGGWLGNPGAELVAVCDCDPEAEGRVADKFPDMPQIGRAHV